VLGEDGLKGPEAAGRVDVSHDANHDHGGSLHDGDGLNHFFLVDLCRTNKTVTFYKGKRWRLFIRRYKLRSVLDIHQGVLNPLCPPVERLIIGTTLHVNN